MLRLLAAELVTLEVVDTISASTVMGILKKNATGAHLNRRRNRLLHGQPCGTLRAGGCRIGL